MSPRPLATIRRKLLDHHGEFARPAMEDPFQWILWEQVAYLADDEKRRRAFDLLARRVGLAPSEIAKAKPSALEAIAASGGSIAADKRAERMKDSARRVLSEWEGDLGKALRLPLPEAIRALSRFPMIGRPGAEKILLLTRAHPVLALESNGLRVLLRLGYGTEDRRYERTYESVRATAAEEAGKDLDDLISLHHLLRRHGQTVCRNTTPACDRCPLTAECAFFGARSDRS